jgi:hypothetical protein
MMKSLQPLRALCGVLACGTALLLAGRTEAAVLINVDRTGCEIVGINEAIAQSFRVATPSSLDKIEMWITPDLGQINRYAMLLRDSGSLIATSPWVSVAPVSSGGVEAWRTFSFQGLGVALQANHDYTFTLLRLSAQSGGFAMCDDVYPNGILYRLGSDAFPGHDVSFRLSGTELVPPLVPPYAAYMSNYATGQWNGLPDLGGVIVPIRLVAGENTHGPILAGGQGNRFLQYMDDYLQNVWHPVRLAPFDVTAIAGNNQGGILIAGGADRRSVAYMSDYGEDQWHQLAPNAPWPISGLAGENTHGPVIFGGDNDQQVAFLSDYGHPAWVVVQARAPFRIKGISGDNAHGVVVFGGDGNNRVAYLTNYMGSWTELPPCPVPITYIAGDNTTGPLVAGGSDAKQIWTLSSYVARQWVQQRGVPANAVWGIAGNNGSGPIVIGHQ